VPRHRPLVLKAFVEEMVNVVGIGSILEQQEETLDVADQSNDAQNAALARGATSLFDADAGEILHNGEHCEPLLKRADL
jgi:hypothetical protein